MSVARFFRLRSPLAASALLGASVFLATPAAHAQTIADLFNTGVDGNNTLLAGGATDTHYIMIANDAGLVNGTGALVNSNQLVGTYAQNPTSQYVSPDGMDGGSVNGGGYVITYRTTFTLPINVILSSVNITGGWSTDNLGNDILINGNSTGLTSPGFSTFTAFTLPTTFFQVGTNTLDFVLENQGGPGGLNVAYTTQSFAVQGAAAAAPEPGSIALALAVGVPALGIVRRRKHRV